MFVLMETQNNGPVLLKLFYNCTKTALGHGWSGWKQIAT